MYGLCMAVGIYAAFLVAFLLIKDRQKFLDFLVVSVVSLAFGVTGAKIVYLLTAHPVKDFFTVVWKMLFTKGNPELSGGFVFFGGLIFGPIGYLLGCRIVRTGTEEANETGIYGKSAFLDEYAVVIPLAHAFGRIGCFYGGCCYGVLYEGLGHVVYKHPITSVPTGVGIFPVQLLESLLLFILFGIIFALYIKKKSLKSLTSTSFTPQNSNQTQTISVRSTSSLFPIYLLSYSLIRFCTEFLRGDSERGHFYIFSTSQWISLVGITVAIGWLIFQNINKKLLYKETL